MENFKILLKMIKEKQNKCHVYVWEDEMLLIFFNFYQINLYSQCSDKNSSRFFF